MQKENKLTVGQWCDYWFTANRRKWNGNTEGGYTEPTIMQSKDGKPLNGNLLYTIHPIPGVLEAFYERQFRQAEEAAARYRAAQLLEKSNAQGCQNALCAPFREEASPSPSQRIEAGCEPFSADFCRTKEKAG